jgi:arrestin-related trafficking adapter 3/6
LKYFRIDTPVEKIDYFVRSHQLNRSETVRRFQLLSIRHPQSLSSRKEVARNAPPLLPIWSREPSQSSEAVLLPYADPPSTDTVEQTMEEQETEGLAHLLNPTGPWHLHGMLRLPLNHLHITHRRHDLSFVSIKHVLKVIMRVERGDNESVDPKTGKKKQFDIIIETPVNILSVCCASVLNGRLFTRTPRNIADTTGRVCLATKP